MECIKPNKNESYNDYIVRIYMSRGNKIKEDVYKEKHHIIPRSKGGSDKKTNLIELLPEEHYWAHMILSRENPNHKGLITAWFLMTNNNEFATAEEYAEARKLFITNQKGKDNFFSNENLERYHGYSKKAVILEANYLKGQNEPIIFENAQDAEWYIGIPKQQIEIECLIKKDYHNWYYLYDYMEQTGYQLPEKEGAIWYLKKKGLLDDED